MAVSKESGQALLETLITFPVGVLAFTLIFYSLASLWSVFWVEHQMQEAVICLSDASTFECQSKHKRLIHNGAHYLKINTLILEKRDRELYGKIFFSFPFQGRQKFNLEKTIPWPIRQ